jgi:hypothetical protein
MPAWECMCIQDKGHPQARRAIPARIIIRSALPLRIADARIRQFLRIIAEQGQDCTKEDEETLWEMSRGRRPAVLGLVSLIKARFSPGKRLQLKDSGLTFYGRPQPPRLVHGTAICPLYIVYDNHRQRHNYRENICTNLPSISISSRMQIFPGQSTCETNIDSPTV